jgi:hypothetical protein
MIIKRAFFLFFIFSNSVLVSQNIQFYREDLIFRLSEKHLTVDGMYYFCNVSRDTVSSILFYPFPLDKDYGKIDSVEVVAYPELNTVTIQNTGKGLYFKVNVNPYNARKYKIKYRQKILGNKAEYILLSTQQWRKSLELGNYKLIVPHNLQLDSLSVKPDTLYNKIGYKLYCWQKRDYMPDGNILFYFKNAGNK